MCASNRKYAEFDNQIPIHFGRKNGTKCVGKLMKHQREMERTIIVEPGSCKAGVESVVVVGQQMASHVCSQLDSDAREPFI